MTEKKIIAVVGATGSQGGGLVQAILADPDHEFAVRALTRNAQSGKARELAAAGAEVVEMELQQAEAAVLATKAAAVAHVIWSTLEDTRPHFGDGDRVPTVDELYKVPHFDAKGEADELFTKYGVPTTFLRTAFFFEGFASGLGPVRDASGKLVLTLPMADQPLSGIAVEDIGKTALGIFKRGPALIGQTVSIAGDHLTGNEYAAALTDALGELVVYQPNSWDDFRRLAFPGAVEMANMFQFYAEDSKRFTGDRNLGTVRTLNPQLQSFRDWLALHKNEIT
jgi:uncharacterized protein YbjT (DUF2867 family)